MLVEVVLFDGCLWENANGHFHILITIHGRAEIEIFYVKTEISGVFCADDAVPQHLCCCEICCACCEFSWVFDEVSACSEADSIWICLLRSVVDNDPGVCDGAIVGYVTDLFVVHDEY